MPHRGWVLVAALVGPLFARATALDAQSPSDFGPVVSAEWLASQRAASDLVILQVSNAEGFARAHPAGAQHLEWPAGIAAAPVAGGLRLELPDSATLQAALRARGVSSRSRVVLLFDQPSGFTFVGRAFLTLEWAGLRGRVAVLDGGLPAWIAAGLPTAEGAAAAVAAGDIVVRPQWRLIATRDSVVAATAGSGRRLVDARAPQFYRDEQPNNMPRGGHIPTAINLPFSVATTPDGRLKPRAELEALVAAAGIGPDERLTTYCHIGQQASWMYFVLRTLGRDVTMYDGSFDEWSRAAELPVSGQRARTP